LKRLNEGKELFMNHFFFQILTSVSRKELSNMSAITTLNPKAESARQAQALAINISAARGLADILKTNLGPKGTMKMYALLHFFSYHLLIL